MANSNPRLGYISARYLASDGVGDGAQTCATTSSLPVGAVPIRTTVIARGAVAASGSATVKVTCGGIDVSSAIAKAKLAAAGYIVTENVPETADVVIDSNVGIGVTLASTSGGLTGGTADLDIIIEYIMIE